MSRIHRVGKTLTVLAAYLVLGAGGIAAQGKTTTLTLFSADTNPNWTSMQDEIGKIITAKTGVILKQEFATGDPGQKISLIVASKQYPDLIMPKGDAGTLVDEGAMIDLAPLIDQYAPNIKRVIGDQLARMRYSGKQPQIFFLPNNDAIGQVDFDADAWFKLQLGALKEQKYPAVKTLADYERVIATYVKAHPTTNGQPTIGLSLLADDWHFVISVTNPAFWAGGFADDGEWAIDEKTFKAVPQVLRPESKEYFRWLNHMNDIGLLDRESFVQKFDQYKAKIKSGRVVGLIDASWEISDAIDELKKAGQFDKTYGRFGAVLKAGIKAAYNRPTGFRGGYGIGITTACKDPVLAIKFLDYLSSDEGQILNNWGVKDKHYTLVNGIRTPTAKVLDRKSNGNAAFTRETGIGNYSLSLRYGDGVKDASGSYYTAKFPESILKSYSDEDLAALKAYKVSFWSDLLPKPSEFTVIPWAAAWSIPTPQNSPLYDFWNVEQDVNRKYIPMAILAKPGDFDRIWDSFTSELHAKTDKYAELETELVKDRLKLWGLLK